MDCVRQPVIDSRKKPSVAAEYRHTPPHTVTYRHIPTFIHPPTVALRRIAIQSKNENF